MVRIALIAGTYALDRCGVAHYTAHLRTALAQRHVESVVLTTQTAARESADPTVLGAVSDWRLGSLLALIQAVHQTQVDILHIQHAAGTYGFERSLFLLPLLLRASGWKKPIVTTVHEYGWWEWQPEWIPQSVLEWVKEYGQQYGWWDREDGFLLTGSDAIITTNGEAEHVIIRRLPHLKKHLHRIPIGANITVKPIDRAQARQALLQRCHWSEEATVIAFFGFLHPVKGLETLLSAFQKVVAVQPNARLILIGGVESLALQAEAAKQYWEKLEQAIASLNLVDQVHMTGYLDADTASIYLTGSDIGVLPFNHGVTLKSGSLLAMMAHRLPTIATASNDFELRESDITRLVPPRDVESLAIALIELLDNPQMQQHLVEAGHAFSQTFNWSSIAESHLDVYRSVVPYA